MQSAFTVFMVRPASFGFNAETAPSNSFQQLIAGQTPAVLQARALAEFDAAVAQLRAHGMRVLIFDDLATPACPDAVFPNNWVSLHADGRVLLYPMCAPNRRPERRPDIVAALAQEFVVTELVDFGVWEQQAVFLEGTGSIIFDHEHRVAYAGLSPRTDAGLLAEVCARLDYRPVLFRAQDVQGQEIYHTNVLMSVGPGFAVVCLESIRDAAERAAVVLSLQETGHELVDISLAQVARFAGNMLALQPAGGPALLALSQSAHDILTPAQRQTLSTYAKLLPLPIPTIETVGGGSVRCMLAEVFLPEQAQTGSAG
ncbi:citrulline utilization hydrolase CtlX [Hymenobacter puniceus]|uniref:citrulline utilization hydrolase CtlX n=1 Tax=Hymenobacter sp. BT190 TaxID=2763505 RepID=UPI00165149CF|nr:arginine deiminase-related protein [Hymenobacter sp. BT190]MBC6699194.1 amidinotransferase [Hymenobacter sp. BT190]